jgi:multidrug efflux pump subunit AcrA (membrane-fusion protein)
MKLFTKFRKLFLVKLLFLNKKRKELLKKALLFIAKKPFTSFFAVLAVFLILMIIGNVLFSPKPVVQNNLTALKQVQIYKIGSAPEVSYQGKVEKSGVIKIVSQTTGIVNSINVYEGQQIDSGTNILSLSTNYSGGNAASISRQIAQSQYQNAKDTFNTQEDIIVNQRAIADKNKSNSDQMRAITTQSAIDTQALFDLNKTIVDSLSSSIGNLENTNVNGSNDAAILQAKQQIAGFQSAMVQTNSSFQNLQIESNQNSSDASTLSYEIALKQLDVQEKALNMSLDISRLSYNMAQVLEANMFPSTPFAGVVNKIFVHVGDNVTSGTILASISGDNQHVEIVVNVSGEVAKNISNFEPSTLYIGDKSIQMLPTFVSKDATSGVLYSVIYDLDDSLAANLTDSTYINVKIPVGVADTTNIDPFIPLDSVVQTQDEAFVYVVDNKNTARVKKITLGQIQGRYVEVLSGLPINAQVIIDRNVIEGDKVQVLQ